MQGPTQGKITHSKTHESALCERMRGSSNTATIVTSDMTIVRATNHRAIDDPSGSQVVTKSTMTAVLYEICTHVLPMNHRPAAHRLTPWDR